MQMISLNERIYVFRDSNLSPMLHRY